MKLVVDIEEDSDRSCLVGYNQVLPEHRVLDWLKMELLLLHSLHQKEVVDLSFLGRSLVRSQVVSIEVLDYSQNSQGKLVGCLKEVVEEDVLVQTNKGPGGGGGPVL